MNEAFLGKLKMPTDYPGDTKEALVMFCGRFLEILLFAPSIRMCRLGVAEATRFPEGSVQYVDVIFSAPHERLSAYLKERFGLSAKASSEAPQELLGRVIYPRFPRALLASMSFPISWMRRPSERFDLKPVRKVVAELIESLEENRRSR